MTLFIYLALFFLKIKKNIYIFFCFQVFYFSKHFIHLTKRTYKCISNVDISIVDMVLAIAQLIQFSALVKSRHV